MYLVASIRHCLCVCNPGVYADNLAEAVDRLLMKTPACHTSRTVL